MDPISIIEGALVAGATMSAQPFVDQMVKDTYDGLKALIIHRSPDKPKAEATLKEHGEDSDTYAKPLQKLLRTAQVEQDEEVLEAAQKLLKLAPQSQIGLGKQTIFNNSDVYGQNNGDFQQITQHFGGEPPKQ